MKHLSSEHKKRISETLKRKIATGELVTASDAFKGSGPKGPKPKEWREAISKGMTGVRHSKQSLERKSKSCFAYWNSEGVREERIRLINIDPKGTNASKLTRRQAWWIKFYLLDVMTINQLAKVYNMTNNGIKDIEVGRTWASLGLDFYEPTPHPRDIDWNAVEILVATNHYLPSDALDELYGPNATPGIWEEVEGAYDEDY